MLGQNYKKAACGHWAMHHVSHKVCPRRGRFAKHHVVLIFLRRAPTPELGYEFVDDAISVDHPFVWVRTLSLHKHLPRAHCGPVICLGAHIVTAYKNLPRAHC